MSNLQNHTWVEPLSPREIQILELISDGLSNREISLKLMLSPETIKWYNKQIFNKLGVNNRAQAVKIAVEDRLLETKNGTRFEEEHRRLGNLPAQLTSFVGRVNEIAQIKQLLKSYRLITLTGTGGSGKTRLALQVAADLSDNYREGVWLVELASINDPRYVPEAIAWAVKIPTCTDAFNEETLKRYLARKHLLLLLDNFEHLLDTAPLVGKLLAAAPRLTVLATSRERLHLYGEREFQVQPLNLPDSQNRESPEQLLQYDAINLFVQRARTVRSGFHLDETQAAIVTQICTRLDGLPLAIELAASRLKILSPAHLAQQLEASFSILSRGPRDLSERQRTWQATIEWSYNLLTKAEKILFARLAVFKGGATMESIKYVCSGGMLNPENQLYNLVEKNLVIPRQDRDDDLRFNMLESIREFAQKLFLSSQEAENLHLKHAQYFTRLAEKAEPEFGTAKRSYWGKRLRADKDNLFSALSWSLNGDQIEYGIRLTSTLREYWVTYGLGSEGRRWTELALEKAEDSAPELRAGVLRSAGDIAYTLGDIPRGKMLLNQALDLYQELGDEFNLAVTMVLLSITFIGNASEIHKGKALCAQGLNILRMLETKPGMAKALIRLGELSRVQGDDEAARHYYEESLTIVRETGNLEREAALYNNLSYLDYHQQKHQNARQLAQNAIRTIQDKDYCGLAVFLSTLAGPTAALGKPDYAAQLLGASHGVHAMRGSQDPPADKMEAERIFIAVQNQLEEKDFQIAFQAGQAMSVQEAINFALEELDLGE